MILFAAVEQANPLLEIFENNVINWLVLVGLIVYLGKKVLPGLLAQRKDGIESALKEAQLARAEGLAFLEAQKNKVANAEKDAESILVEARQVADEMKAQMEDETKKEMADLELKIEQQIANERQLAITQLRTAAARAAIQLSESILPQHVTDRSREHLLSQFLEELKATGK